MLKAGFADIYATGRVILMEGALAVRLRLEYGIVLDENVTMAGLVYDDRARDAMAALWSGYAGIARRHGMPFLATTPTRRVTRDRLARSAFSEAIFADNVAFLKSVGDASGAEMFTGAMLGSSGNAYTGEGCLPEEEAYRYHSWAAERQARAGAEMLFAAIMPTIGEAAGMARACSDTGVPYVISFMTRRDGRLPDGTAISEAMERIDGMVSLRPLCYMANCVHPEILLEGLGHGFNRTEIVSRRFRGIQANASSLSPDELDGAAGCHTSSPESLAEAMGCLDGRVRLQIVGGCCGTDDSHIGAIAERFSPTI